MEICCVTQPKLNWTENLVGVTGRMKPLSNFEAGNWLIVFKLFQFKNKGSFVFAPSVTYWKKRDRSCWLFLEIVLENVLSIRAMTFCISSVEFRICIVSKQIRYNFQSTWNSSLNQVYPGCLENILPTTILRVQNCIFFQLRTWVLRLEQ